MFFVSKIVDLELKERERERGICIIGSERERTFKKNIAQEDVHRRRKDSTTFEAMRTRDQVAEQLASLLTI